MSVSVEKLWFPFGLGEVLAAQRLFCLPYAGGGASAFVSWRKALPGIAVIPVQYPGRETRLNEPCAQDMDKLVDTLATAMIPHLDRPYALFGYSLGAKIGFALCHRLQALGAPGPHAFLVAAHRTPDMPPSHPGSALLPDEQFNDLVRRYGGTSEIIFQDKELANMLVPILRADFALIENPVPTQPLDCPVLAYAGDEDALATPAMLREWRRFTRHHFELRTFQGGHFFARTDSKFLSALGQDVRHYARRYGSNNS